MHGIRVLMAKDYIDNLSEEVTKGMVEKPEQGMWPSYAPLGYRNVAVAGEPDSRKKMIEPDPERAPLIVQLFEWYATGDYSIKELGRMARNSADLPQERRAPSRRLPCTAFSAAGFTPATSSGTVRSIAARTRH